MSDHGNEEKKTTPDTQPTEETDATEVPKTS